MCSTVVAGRPSRAESGSLNEQQFVGQVLAAGLAARVADAEMAVARAASIGVGAWQNPSLTWQRESGGSQGDTTGARQDIFALSVPLALSGRLGLERESALKGTKAATFRRDRARAELRYQAVRQFYGVLAARERSRVLSQSLEAVQQLANSIAAREKAGDASGYDRLRIGLEAATLRDLSSQAALDERTARSEALRLLGADRTTLPTLVGDLVPGRLPGDGGGLAADAESRRADLHGLQLEREAAEVARGAAARGWLPDPTISGGIQLLDGDRAQARTGYVVGVEIPLPLFQRRQGEQARSAAQRDLLDAQRAALVRDLHVRLAASLEQSDARRKRRDAHGTEILSRAEELRRIATAAYRGGASDLLVLVDAERSARDARLAAVDLAQAVIEADNELLLLAGAYDGMNDQRAK